MTSRGAAYLRQQSEIAGKKDHTTGLNTDFRHLHNRSFHQIPVRYHSLDDWSDNQNSSSSLQILPVEVQGTGRQKSFLGIDHWRRATEIKFFWSSFFAVSAL